MAKNSSLQRANNIKNDEFYTMIADIEREMRHYKDFFKDKIIFCNCDDPETSDFWKYFKLNFYQLDLKKLISTHYDPVKPTYKLEMSRIDSRKNQMILPDVIQTPLKENGDFRSEECVEILKESDIVITNPPFSLFREYVGQLMDYDKKFIIIGSKNAITYKDIFKYIQENRMWLGYGFKGGNAYFKPKKILDYADGVFDETTQLVKFRNCGWYTNLDVTKRHEDLPIFLTYNPEYHIKYDNYDAINVDKVKEIPCDYFGIMGVPITFMDNYNPNQFEILGITDRQNTYGLRTKKYTIEDDPKFNDLNAHPVIKIDGVYKSLYARLLIRRKHNENSNE